MQELNNKMTTRTYVLRKQAHVCADLEDARAYHYYAEVFENRENDQPIERTRRMFDGNSIKDLVNYVVSGQGSNQCGLRLNADGYDTVTTIKKPYASNGIIHAKCSLQEIAKFYNEFRSQSSNADAISPSIIKCSLLQSLDSKT